jgi:KDO2-lipid IV(A) lauroyltransferase
VPGGIAQLALKSGAAILPGYCRYDKSYSSTYYIGAAPPIFPQRTGDKRADTIGLMQQMFDAMEEIIRQYPDQWEMFRRFWPEEDAPALTSATPRRLLATPTIPAAAAGPAVGEHTNG